MAREHLSIVGDYDPEALGARCDLCTLKRMRVGGPVAPEFHDRSIASVIAESPGDREREVGRPLVGPSGMEFTDSLKAIGMQRTQVDIHLAVACMPPENDLDKVMLRWQRDNTAREAAGEERVPSPIDCCRPRLQIEIGHENVITLGKVAYESVARTRRSILDIRGGPVTGGWNAAGDFVASTTDWKSLAKPLRVLPTLHPGFVMKMRRWTRAFRSDLSRAFRWFSGHLGWQHPVIKRNPTPDELELFLRRTDTVYVVDVETTFDDPTEAKLKCIGIGTESHAVVIHLLSIEGPDGALVQGPYTDSDELAIRGILRDFFVDQSRVKAGHNAGYFDKMVIRQHFGVDMDPLMDTILLHRSVESELPHKLGYVGSVYTDVTAWKDAHTAAVAASDEELGVYCAIDCVVTARALPKLAEAVKLRSQEHVVAFDHRIQDVCVGLHRTGMLVDMGRRHAEAGRLSAEITRWSAETRKAAGLPTMNLNSTPQLRKLLFSEWKLTPASYTKLGDPSTDDESLRLIRTQNRHEPQVVEFIDSLRRFRRAAKEFGTYVKRMVPYGQPIDGVAFRDEGEEEEAARGLIMPDGRVRPDYNAHGTTSGRLSSSNPNAQNWPKHLRAMIVPAPGNVIVGADADQLELRIIAAVAGIGLYLDVFDEGGDPHAMTASLMFGKDFDRLEPKTEQWDKLRKIAKSIKYASFYGSGDETVHNLVTSAEDADGKLLYPDLTLREIATLRRRWLKGIPQLANWWEDTLEQFRHSGFIIDPVLGRRRDFLDGENMNEIVNFPIQSAGAHIIHLSTFDLVKEIPFEKWGPGTGLIAQVHDALYVECPESEAAWVADCIKHHMNRVVPGLPGVTFSAKPKVGRHWGEV